ncbi:MAG: hypothetical protein F6J92_08555 [Symploca sp. SIO1A3]|nr:hypothetical protein [Symploca sp. SIO1A3]
MVGFRQFPPKKFTYRSAVTQLKWFIRKLRELRELRKLRKLRKLREKKGEKSIALF